MNNPNNTTSDDTLLDVKAVAAAAGVTPATIKVYQNRASKRRREGRTRAADLPEPDARFSRVAVWHRSTIDAWLARRPGPGKQSPLM